MRRVDDHESLRTRAAKLAAAAAALKRRSGTGAASFSLAFLTDARRLPRPEPVMRALPAGAAVVFRDYDDPRRAAAARRYAAICAARGVLFIVAGDARLALACGADGVHLPSAMLAGPMSASAARAHAPGRRLIVTASCHDERELRLARAHGADVAFLSPAFATASHPGADHLGPARFRRIAAASPLPVLALGGVDEANAMSLAGENVAGFGAIGAFARIAAQ